MKTLFVINRPVGGWELDVRPPLENYIIVQNQNIKEITGRSAGENHLYPWRSRIVAIKSQAGRLHRIIKGHGDLSINGNECVVGLATMRQLDVANGDPVEVSSCNQVVGRFLYYYNHRDDVTRMTAKLAYLAILLAILLPVVGWVFKF